MKAQPLIRAALLLLAAACPCEGEEATLLYSGSVTDQMGRPLEGVIVKVLSGAEDAPATATDEDGLFWIEAPPEIPIRFEKDGYIPGGFIPDPGKESLLVRLNRAASITVEVRDHEGTRVPGAKVVLFEARDPNSRRDRGEAREEEEPRYRGKTGKDGRAAFPAVEPGRYRIGVLAEGFYEKKHRPISLKPGKPRWITLELVPILTLSGRILDAEGRPVQGAELTFPKNLWKGGPRYWSGWGDVRYEPSEWTEADEEGRFRAHWTTSFGILARAAGFAPSLMRIRQEKGETHREVEIVLQQPATVSGRVVNEAGEGVSGVDLLVQVKFALPPDDRRDEPYTSDPFDLYQVVHSQGDAGDPGFLTNAEGWFRIEPVPPGEVQVVLQTPGRFKTRSKTIKIEAGDFKTGIEIELTGGLSIHGVVENEKGVPVAGAMITCTARGRGGVEIETDMEGRFTLPGLKQTTRVYLKVEAPGYGTQLTNELRAGPEPRVIRLLPSGSISGAVYDASTGEPVTLFSLDAKPFRKDDQALGHRHNEDVTSQDGTFHVEGISKGTYQVSVYSEGYLRESIDKVEVVAGQETPLLPIQLKRGREVWGTVTSIADGLPVPGVSVIKGDRYFYQQNEETDAEGRWRLSGLEAKEQTLIFQHADYARAVRTLNLAEEKDPSPVDVRLGQGGRVEITLLDAEGVPQPGTRVYLQEPPKDDPRLVFSGGAHRAKTGPDGIAHIERVSPGVYLASPTGFAFPQGSKEVRVEEGRTTHVTLEPGGAVLSGRLTWGGKPVTGAEVSLSQVIERGFSTSSSRQGVPKATVSGHRYEAGPLSPGTYRLSATAEVPDPGAKGGVRNLSVAEKIEIPEEASRFERDLAFPAFRFAGRVVRADTGEAVPKVPVILEGSGSGLTDEAGNFDILADRAGLHKVRVRVYGWRDELSDVAGWVLLEPKEITIPEEGALTGQVLKIGPGGVITGIVRDHLGNVVPGAQVRFQSDSTRSREPYLHFQGFDRTTGDVEGRYRLEGLAHGAGILTVSHAHYAPTWIPGLVVGEAEVRRDAVLEPGGSLEILSPPAVKITPQNPYSGIELIHPAYPLSVGLRDPVWHGDYLQMTPSGSWLLPHLPEGTWTLNATIVGKTIRRVVEVREGAPAVVDLGE